MRISDWSSDVCSSDLAIGPTVERDAGKRALAPCLDSHGKPAIGHVAAKLFRRPLHGPEDARLPQHAKQRMQIGRASCRERVCQYVEISVVAVSSTKKKNIT